MRRLFSPHHSRSLLVVVFAAAWLIGGCNGHARVHLIPTGPKAVPTAGPLMVRLSPSECYFWTGDKGRLVIAMREHRPSLLGPVFQREFLLSLVLDETPAGRTRYYRGTRRTMRSHLRAGYGRTRAASLTGSVLIKDFGADRITGRFRIKAKQQSFFVLTGWGSDASVLLVGEFEAVENRRRGEKILAQTEAPGMERLPSRKPIPVNGPPRDAAENADRQGD